MALTADQLAQLRRMVADTTAEVWSDDLLQAAAEAYATTDGYDLRALSASLWEERAASAWELVQTAESGSSRSAQQAFDHAVVMAKRFGDDSSSGTDNTTVYPQNTKIVRATRGA
jgi:hypothetical protein